jgi:phage-related minor tail protein
MAKKPEEKFKVKSEDLVDKIKQLIQEGNVRRISVKTKEGKSIIEIPLTVGVVGAIIAPILAAVGAIAALVAECTISVKREHP